MLQRDDVPEKPNNNKIVMLLCAQRCVCAVIVYKLSKLNSTQKLILDHVLASWNRISYLLCSRTKTSSNEQGRVAEMSNENSDTTFEFYAKLVLEHMLVSLGNTNRVLLCSETKTSSYEQ